MQLTWNSQKKVFGLYVPRGHVLTPDVLMNEYGLDFSETASTAEQAVFVTNEHYAAASFFQYGSSEAKAQLELINREIERSQVADCNRQFPVPPGEELWPFQKADLDYALDRRNTLIGDQPGLGKTQVAIAYCNERQAGRNLVICPASLRLQWANRIRAWSTVHQYASNAWVHIIGSGRHGVAPKADYVVVSYELARNPEIAKALARFDWDTLILDEVHYLKELDTLRSRTVWGGGDQFADWNRVQDVDGARLLDFRIPLMEVSKNTIALSGTPMPNRPAEAYPILRHFDHAAIDGMSEERFRARFNPPARMGISTKSGKPFVMEEEKTGREAELGNRLRANVMTRHLKREVMTQLKMPVYGLITVTETTPVKQALKAESMLDLDGSVDQWADIILDPSNGGVWATARRMMGEAIAPQVVDWVNMLIDGGEEKLVLFAWHKSVVDYLAAKLGEHGVLVVTGTTSAHRKDQYVNAFISDPRHKVIVGNLLSLGTGTDGLQKVCNHALIVEPSPVPGENVQCFDRLDRGGQNRTVYGEIFVAPGSILEQILARALSKLQTLHSTLDKRVGAM